MTTNNVVAITASHRCQAGGCDRVTVGTRYCDRCAEEIAALRAWAAETGGVSRMTAALFRLRGAVRRHAWVVLTVFVVCALAFMAAQWAEPTADWIDAGGFWR